MNELQRILVGNAAAAPPSHILEGLNEKLVHRKPAGAPHSIYEEAWHIAYWLEMSLDWIGGTPTPYPSSASDGFPTVLDMENELWPALHARVLDGLERASAAAGETSQLNVLVACPTLPPRPTRSMTVREQLENLGAHNSYHFGRIVLLRQLMGCWPPPSGGDTW